ncbi:alpha/beta-hydrolase, partial [Aspergillus ellipticus CBS 707.79]
LLISGLGGTHTEWSVIQSLLSPHARVYSYDRAGYGLSTPSPLPPPTARNRISELTSLLTTANIPPPYILVGHSYGGVLIREFLRVHTSTNVVGMVLLDSWRWANPLPAGWTRLLGPGGWAGFYAVVGVEQRHRSSNPEWAEIKAGEERDGEMMMMRGERRGL